MNSKLNNYADTLSLNINNNNTDSNNSFIFTSHEGLLLNYEECFIRSIDNKYYNLSSHTQWIGERTNSIDEAHIEFFSGLENPIGVKVSSRTVLEDLIKTIKKLNPLNELGKIMLITRFGLNQVQNPLTLILEKIKLEKLNVLFICDPNHGNTKVDEKSKKKVRYFDDLKNEIILTNKILNDFNFHLSGIHLEASCYDVTECLGGIENKIEEIDEDKYTTYCDPRLNFQQVKFIIY